jgi:very-short-patch-repair endonuclease
MRAGVPTPVPQCPVRLDDGRLIHLDFGWPDKMVGLEVDHPAWHDGAEHRANDMYRDRKATRQGWIVSRLSQSDIDHRLADAVADVAEIVRSRPAGFSPMGAKP